ncbi:MAG: hypothetical protein GXP42_18650 [Chloroflexi bacterium]|nr:hypothetical protein [Chloroflexota bacterium]
MPILTRVFVKTALVYLIAALVAGMLLAARAVFDLADSLVALTPVYFHLFMVGWVLQLIFGMIYWMFPKYSRERPRGNDAITWMVYYLLNAGLLLRVIGEPLQAAAGDVWGWLLPASALLQWLAGALFVINTWPRVKER